jgi:hypothetical protein
MMENALTNPHLEVARNRMICGRWFSSFGNVIHAT